MSADLEPGRRATRAVLAVTVLLGGLSLRQIVLRVPPAIPYAGMKAMSEPIAEPPLSQSAPWVLSAGVMPPREGATHAELLAWLAHHYPVLGFEPYDAEMRGSTPVIDLGGGPPRVLYVEPGKGLVARTP